MARSRDGWYKEIVSIWKLLGIAEDSQPSSASETQAVRHIAASLNRLEPDRARYLATFAYILSRVANVDLDVSDEETREMERIIMEHGQLPEEQAVMVVQMARTQSLVFSGTDDFLVTREFDRIATRDDKLALLHCLFSVSSADQTVLTIEDNEIRRITLELRIEHADFIKARSAFRDRLAVLQDGITPKK